MAVIENKIQYNWVRKRVAKLKEKVDENTSSYNPYRIELELLSKLEKEYSDGHTDILEKEKVIITETTPKTQVHIYEGLPIVLEKVKSVALSAVMGKSNTWLNNKMNGYTVNGKTFAFTESDISQINSGLQLLGEEISQNMIQFVDDREEVIRQVKELATFVRMAYIYGTVMGKVRQWYNTRMLARVPGRKVCVFKEDDIHAINKAAMQIANELKSTEFIL